jgi:hypothetical protein
MYADTGLVYLSASMVDEAKRWFESSTIICRFVPDGRQRAEKVGKVQWKIRLHRIPQQISTTYSDLLARYPTK